jgi:hypothetical protein
MKNSNWIVASVLPCALASVASASIIYVDENSTGPVHDGTTWCSAFTTLDAGLAAAVAGDTIRVADGLYTPDPTGLIDPRAATFHLKSDVTISTNYAGCGAINPDARDPANFTSYIRGDPFRDDNTTGNTSNNSYHVMTAASIGGAALDGLYVDAGRADNPLATDALNGAGLLAIDSSLSASSCIFQGNEAVDSVSGTLGRGGSVYARRSKLTFKSCLFRESISGEKGGGLYSESSSIAHLSSTFAACITNGQGGGCFSDGRSNVYVDDGWFLVCSANDAGGGMYNNGATALVVGTQFQSSWANNGGAVYDHNARADFVNTRFWPANQVNNDGACIYNTGSVTTLMNCLLAGNDAGNLGGGIVNNNAKFSVTNCTIADNTAGAGAAGIELFGGVGGSVTNSILWNNSTSGLINESTQIRVALGTSLSLNYSDVTGLTGGLGGVGNIGANPLFVAPGSGDYRISGGSPCRNTGNNAAIPSDIADLDGDLNVLEQTPLDLDLALRIQGGLNVDMGAYEAP